MNRSRKRCVWMQLVKVDETNGWRNHHHPQGHPEKYEDYHHVHTDGAIEAAVFQNCYIQDRFRQTRPLIDEASKMNLTQPDPKSDRPALIEGKPQSKRPGEEDFLAQPTPWPNSKYKEM